jgi:hypothetical protein
MQCGDKRVKKMDKPLMRCVESEWYRGLFKNTRGGGGGFRGQRNNRVFSRVKRDGLNHRFIWAPCVQLYSLAKTSQPTPHNPAFGLIYDSAIGHWSAKIDDISLWGGIYQLIKRTVDRGEGGVIDRIDFLYH